MPSIVDRYLIREIALTLLATTLVLLAMVLSHRLAGYLSKAANGLLARDSIFLLLGLQAINLLTVLVPVAFLLSIMLALGRLYRDHEMTALAACGYGPLSVYRAVFLLAAPLALFVAGLSFLAIPALMEFQFEVLAREPRAGRRPQHHHRRPGPSGSRRGWHPAHHSRPWLPLSGHARPGRLRNSPVRAGHGAG
ncbi:MAG: permease YjgP/YjgQ family protein [Proteobacteria bacterium]|nr:permease YjgP/YjgQ family protein [Pseudomonadota bacterium]